MVTGALDANVQKDLLPLHPLSPTHLPISRRPLGASA